MAQSISKENQSSPRAHSEAYGFGSRSAAEDLLRSFHSRFQGRALGDKADLMRMLWPDTHVSEANLTNTIVSLRKIVGRAAIRSVSKHGYRFALPVEGEPGISAIDLREVRAREGTHNSAIVGLNDARS